MLILISLYEFYSLKKIKFGAWLIIVASLSGLIFYHPGKLFLPALLITTLICLFIKTSVSKTQKKNFFFFILFLNIIAMFYAAILFPNFQATSRIEAVSIFSKPNFQKILLENLKKNIIGFSMLQLSYFHNTN